MDKQKTEHLKKLLVKQRHDLENTLQLMRDNDTGNQDRLTPTELSNYDNHPADMGTELFFVEQNLAMRVHEEHLLKEIHDALGRMEDEIYGKCAFCGKDIGEERLEAIPYTRLCIDCEEDKPVDMEFLDKQRPNEELVWDAPFGRKYLNKREDDEYEGSDYLNDLEKYGSSDSPQDMGGYHDYEEFFTNEIDKQGIVDDMDSVSNEEYKKQLPD